MVVVVLPFVRLRSYAVGVVIVFVGLDPCRLPRAPPVTLAPGRTLSVEAPLPAQPLLSSVALLQ